MFSELMFLSADEVYSGTAFELMGTGTNSTGQLGLGSSSVDVLNFSQEATYDVKWAVVVSGRFSTLGIKEDGTLWGCGLNGSGELGLGDTNQRNSFTQVGTDTDWATVAIGTAGPNDSLAIKTDGTMWGSGSNLNGVLGLGDTVPRTTFTQVGTDTNWEKATLRDNASAALKTNGTIWQTNRFTGTGTDTLTFTQTGTDTDWVDIEGGWSHHAIKSNGTLWALGYNVNGQLGLGDTLDATTFTQVGTDTDWAAVKTLTLSTVAMKTTGTLWGSGKNARGQLGFGDTAQRTSFAQVGSDTDWDILGGGAENSTVIKTTGTLWGSGRNINGELGLGDTAQRTSFTQVGTNTDWGLVNGGEFYTMAIKSKIVSGTV